jgi:mRNA interferase RelE/StbE
LYKVKNRYKIKLRDAGYRLIYEVHDDFLIVLVVAIGRRDKSEVYELARRR